MLEIKLLFFIVLQDLFKFSELNSREERSRQYFDTVLDLDTNDKFIGDIEWGGLTSEAENIDRQFSYSSVGGMQCQTQAQLLLLEEENTRVAAVHEQEVQGIVKSIVDLNTIFKDLAHMVVEQVCSICCLKSCKYDLSYLMLYLLRYNYCRDLKL